MPLTSLTGLLADAQAGGYALGYFEAWDGYSLEAVVEAAEAERAPVILGFGCLLVEERWRDAGGIETDACLGRALAERTTVPCALLLNEARTLEQAWRGVEAGFNAVMLRGSDVQAVSELALVAHARDVAVEGELGTLPHGSGADGALTDPEEAAAFAVATGVDCLAVSIGNVHVLEGQTASVDLARLDAIHRHARIPLALHGGTSFPPEAVSGAIDRGVAKVNVGTVLKRAFLEGLTQAAADADPDVSPHDLLGSHGRADLLEAGKARMIPVVRDLIRLYGGSGRAA